MAASAQAALLIPVVNAALVWSLSWAACDILDGGGSLLGFLGVKHFKGRWKTAVDEKIVQKNSLMYSGWKC